jgi:hypothetical protein
MSLKASIPDTSTLKITLELPLINVDLFMISDNFICAPRGNQADFTSAVPYDTHC